VDPYLTIALVIALLCVSAVCIVLITVLVRAREVLNGIERDMREVTTRAPRSGKHGVHLQSREEYCR
jgi:uncharacterized protein YoxC